MSLRGLVEEEGFALCVTHGNGPQIGLLALQVGLASAPVQCKSASPQCCTSSACTAAGRRQRRLWTFWVQSRKAGNPKAGPCCTFVKPGSSMQMGASANAGQIGFLLETQLSDALPDAEVSELSSEGLMSWPSQHVASPKFVAADLKPSFVPCRSCHCSHRSIVGLQ